jgi:predicted DNA-binding transcriptional regulator AlpA
MARREAGSNREAIGRPSRLPPSLLPFAVAREDAAALLGVSASHFDSLVTEGLMPQPRELRGRVLWDTEEIKEAWRAIPRRGQSEGRTNTWDAP